KVGTTRQAAGGLLPRHGWPGSHDRVRFCCPPRLRSSRATGRRWRVGYRGVGSPRTDRARRPRGWASGQARRLADLRGWRCPIGGRRRPEAPLRISVGQAVDSPTVPASVLTHPTERKPPVPRPLKITLLGFLTLLAAGLGLLSSPAG